MSSLKEYMHFNDDAALLIWYSGVQQIRVKKGFVLLIRIQRYT